MSDCGSLTGMPSVLLKPRPLEDDVVWVGTRQELVGGRQGQKTVAVTMNWYRDYPTHRIGYADGSAGWQDQEADVSVNAYPPVPVVALSFSTDQADRAVAAIMSWYRDHPTDRHELVLERTARKLWEHIVSEL